MFGFTQWHYINEIAAVFSAPSSACGGRLGWGGVSEAIRLSFVLLPPGSLPSPASGRREESEAFALSAVPLGF